ncbi:L-rhamnose-binding lectin CSL3-like [Bolinopsis microptera]|uniref:L-rhamnose-binding lectin CSL3-like n=1 Tax=Bolinopsis microptera TaxID=2820187 RepID=UPI0030792832
MEIGRHAQWNVEEEHKQELGTATVPSQPMGERNVREILKKHRVVTSKLVQAMKERCDGKNSCAVEALNSIFGDPCGGIYKYLTATWECHSENSAEACEHSGIPISINCGEEMINIKHAAYGVYSNENTCGLSYGGDCISETSLQAMKERCDGKNSCAVEALNSIFGDPCGGIYKYLTATWECHSENSAEACEHSGIPISINCGEEMINIKHAAYGVYSNENTCGLSYGGDCISETSLQAMKERCDGKNSCAVEALNSIFGDPCGGIYKYLTATWECHSENSAEACEHSGIPISINCGEEMINIKHAAYGVYSNENTCGRSYGGDCISETSLQV